MESKFIFLKEQITSAAGSSKNKVVYGEEMDLVTIISMNGDVLIVECAKGNRFPVHISKTTAQQVQAAPEPEIVLPPPPKVITDWDEPELINMKKVKVVAPPKEKVAPKAKPVKPVPAPKPTQGALW